MMRPEAVAVPPKAPTGLSYVGTTLSWTDNSIADTGWAVQRLVGTVWTDVSPPTAPDLTQPNTTGSRSYTATLPAGQYRVAARNTVGDTFDYLGTGTSAFPVVTAESYSNIVTVP